jgi:fatty acid synthase
MLSPVLFQETITHIPDNAITIEIAPHCLLQAILSRSLPLTITNISLQKRNHSNNLTFLLSQIGKLYMAGTQPNISKLYPPMSFPVGRGTSMIGHLIRWDHSIKWDVPTYKQTSKKLKRCIEIDISQKKNAYLKGHKINGQIVFPQTACLFFVWKIFALMKNTKYDQLPVIFEHIRFQRVIFMSKKKSVNLTINISKETGTFEICEDNKGMIASGYIHVLPIEEDQESRRSRSISLLVEPFTGDESFMLNTEDLQGIKSTRT